MEEPVAVASHVPETGTASSHHFNHYNIEAFSFRENAKDEDAGRKWVAGFSQAVKPHLIGSVYVSYLGQEGADRVRKA